jgi:hypothetical protein
MEIRWGIFREGIAVGLATASHKTTDFSEYTGSAYGVVTIAQLLEFPARAHPKDDRISPLAVTHQERF